MYLLIGAAAVSSILLVSLRRNAEENCLFVWMPCPSYQHALVAQFYGFRPFHVVELNFFISHSQHYMHATLLLNNAHHPCACSRRWNRERLDNVWADTRKKSGWVELPSPPRGWKYPKKSVRFLSTDATVYVGGLDEKVSEALLWELFLQAGPIGTALLD